MNPDQKKAVAHLNGPCRVVAGAGSGKTTVLTHRIENMIKQGVKPKSIVAITFTRKAADEMADRLKKLIGEETAKDITVCTFHSFCLKKIIMSYAFTHKDQKIVPQEANRHLILGDDALRLVVEAEGMLGVDFDPNVMQGFISWEKNFAVFPGDPLNLDFGGFKNGDEPTKEELELYAKLYEKYEQLKRERGVLDMDDMLTMALLILRKDAKFRKYITDRYTYILVDEFQDTNAAQYDLLRLLTSGYTKNLFIVGDARQAIYGWRGSIVDFILNFEKEWKGATTIALNDNYRSTVEIVDLSTELIEASTVEYPGLCRSGRGNHGQPIKCFVAESPKDEADCVATIIEKTVGRNPDKPYSDFAVLYRTNAQNSAIILSFMERGIPFSVKKSDSFFDRREIQEFLSFMRIASNGRDVVSFNKVSGLLGDKVGKGIVKQIGAKVQGSTQTIPEVIDEFDFGKDEDAECFLRDDFIFLLEKIRQMDESDDYTVKDIMERICEFFDFSNLLIERYAKYDKDFAGRVFDTLMDFVAYCERFKTSKELVEYIDEMERRNSDPKDKNKVQLQTIHASKGLEYDTVFMIGVVNGNLPHSQSMEVDLNKQIIPESIEEERRLCYVAITRAQETLYVSRYKKGANGKKAPASVFWEDIVDSMEDISDEFKD